MCRLQGLDDFRWHDLGLHDKQAAALICNSVNKAVVLNMMPRFLFAATLVSYNDYIF